MLGFVFSLIPGVLPQIVIAEYIVTMFVGVLFYRPLSKQVKEVSLVRKSFNLHLKKQKNYLVTKSSRFRTLFQKRISRRLVIKFGHGLMVISLKICQKQEVMFFLGFLLVY